MRRRSWWLVPYHERLAWWGRIGRAEVLAGLSDLPMAAPCMMPSRTVETLTMRLRTPLLFLGVTMSVVSCLPKPDQDFEDFGKRANALPATIGDGGTFEAAAPPTEAVSGIYYGACL